jgi:hypothetical protein
LAIVVFLECVIIYSSISLGLQDTNPLIGNLGAFTISISPLFHLLPLSVIVVLFASWMYLTRQVASTAASSRPAKTTRPLPPPRKYEKRSFRLLRRFVNRLNRRIEETGRRIKKRISETRLAKYLEQHDAAKAVLKSAWIIVLSFCAVALLIYVIIYPRLIPDGANWLFAGGNSLFFGFVTWTFNAANAVGQTLSPLGWLGSAIISGLAAISPGFRNGMIGLTTPIIKPLVELDLTGKYVLSQNIAAWTSALIALYAGRPSRRRR